MDFDEIGQIETEVANDDVYNPTLPDTNLSPFFIYYLYEN